MKKSISQHRAVNLNGFSLIELMIAVAIVAILAAIAVPSYSAYVRRSNRTDATRTLTTYAQALERCYSQKFTYDLVCAGIVSPSPSPQGYYTVQVNLVAGPPEQYSIQAVPLASPQLDDTSCTKFTLNNAGAQYATDGGGDTTKTCWGST